MRELPVTFNNKGKIVGRLHKTSKPRGLVILVHGFAANLDGPGGTSHKKLSRLLAKESFDVYRFNFRFTSLGWKDFHKMTISGEASDLRLILRKFSKKYRKIAIVAESMGCMISTLAINKTVGCLVFWYPPIETDKTFSVTFESPSALAELKEKGYVTIRKGSTGEGIRVGKKYIISRRKLRLAEYLRKISCPTLIVSPTEDIIVPFWHSQRALKLIKSRNKKLYKIRNSDHGWWKPGRKNRDWKAERIAIMKTVEWIKKWL